MRTSRRLVDACLIKGRLIIAAGTPIRGYVRAWIPGYARGRVYRVLADGRFCIKVPGYNIPEIRLVASSPGYLDLESIIHTRSFIFRKGIFGGYKVVDGGNAVMVPAGPPEPRDLMWFTMTPSGVA